MKNEPPGNARFDGCAGEPLKCTPLDEAVEELMRNTLCPPTSRSEERPTIASLISDIDVTVELIQTAASALCDVLGAPNPPRPDLDCGFDIPSDLSNILESAKHALANLNAITDAIGAK